MKEVSCRVFQGAFSDLDSIGVDRKALIEGVPVELSYIENPKNKIDWDLFAQISANHEKALGGPEQLRRFARSSLTKLTQLATARITRGAFSAVASPRQLYWVTARFLGNSVFSNVHSKYEDLPDGKIRFTIWIDDKFADCPQFFHISHVHMSMLPLMIGPNESQIEAEISERKGVYIITPPPSMTVVTRIKQFFRWLFLGKTALIEELRDQLVELQKSNEEQTRLTHALRDANENLEKKVADRTQELVKKTEEQVAAERAARAKDLALTAAVQTLFLTQSSSFGSNVLRGAGFYLPAELCGGDWWWADEREDHSLLLLVGDVTGHGPGAAMVTAAIANGYRVLKSVGRHLDTQEVLSLLSRTLHESAQGSYLVTMAAVEVRLTEKKVRMWSAGAPPILIRARNGSIRCLGASGQPLGFGDQQFGRAEGPFETGDRLLVCTDGMIDLVEESGQPLGLKRLSEVFQKLDRGEPTQIRDQLVECLERYRSGAPLQDDLSFVVVDRN